MTPSEMQPTVAAVMLANGREDMVTRAWRAFVNQTYQNAFLLVYDTGNVPIRELIPIALNRNQMQYAVWKGCPKSIGALRNDANACANADIILHWDSDDWSHPNRIAEQVTLLQSSGADCVGYNEMLFWKEFGLKTGNTSGCSVCGCMPCCCPGEAWIYRSALDNYCLGTSMCYWRETWERHPFLDKSAGCDDLYWWGLSAQGKLKMQSVTAFGNHCADPEKIEILPRMIASIHGGNTCAKIDTAGLEWLRAPGWDAYCRRVMCG